VLNLLKGDPGNNLHQDAVVALGRYFKANDPNQHLVSTSNWHSFPPQLWRKPDVDYADLHMYLGWGVASGGNRIWPGWDGGWSSPNDATSPGDGFEFDRTTAHSGNVSLKMTVPADLKGRYPTGSHLGFQSGLVPGHQVRVSYWAKSKNIVKYPSSNVGAPALYLYFATYGGDWIGWPFGGELRVPFGTYDWQLVTGTFTVPEDAYFLGVNPRYRATNSESTGYTWIDDILIEDLTTGQILNYNGGFEHTDSESYDVVAGHSAYSRLTHSFEYGKPTIRGEIGFTHPQRFFENKDGTSNPEGKYYRGFLFNGEDQLLIDDTDGIWWKNWVWAQIDADGLYEIYWFPQVLLAGDFKYGKVFQAFMSDIPLSNGHYQDVDAIVSNPVLRVLGQKDLTNNRAHIWIDNSKHTWKNVVDGVKIDSITATVTIPDMAVGEYEVEWWDTGTGEIISTETLSTDADGNLTLTVTDLSTDIAVKIY